MKFYVVVNYYLVSLSFKFHKNPCTNARAQVVNARTRDKTCMRAFTARACVCLHGSLQKKWMFTSYLMSKSFKFCKDRSFR